MIDIKSTSNTTRFSTPINEGSKRKYTLMKEDYITLKFSVDNPVYFKLGDYVDESFGLFELVDLCKPTVNESTGGYDYELRLDAYYWKWKNKIFKFSPEVGGSEAGWNLTAPLDVQLGVFLKNLKALGYKYRNKEFEFSIENTVENKSVSMSYDKTNLLDALTRFAESWECEWWITESVIHFGRCEHGDAIDFELGKNVETMTRSDSQTNFATRVYAFGSTRNIPTNYRPIDENVVVNGIVQKRLMLPVGTSHIDAYPNMPTEEAVEDVVVFDDVFPRMVGVMSNITTKEYTDKIEEEGKEPVYKKWNAYRFKDTGITFSKEYVLAGQELKIIFQSGALNGMEFAVTFNPDKNPEKSANGTWNPDAQVWEIVRNEDYGRELPGDVLIPKNGDTYILSGFDTKFVSDTMIPAAEKELKEKAEKYIEKSKVDPSTYENKMMSDHMVSEDGTLKLLETGDRVNLINAAFFETGSRVSRIIGFEYNLDIPYDSPVYTVGETASYSRIGELESKVDSLTYKGQSYTGTGGSGVYLIRSNDSTPASDSNAFSAKRALKNFLSKTSPDETKFLTKFLGGLIAKGGIDTDSITTINLLVQELATTYDLDVTHVATMFQTVIKDYVSSETFIPGLMGEGMKIYKALNGDWNLEVDNVVIRKVMTIFELVVSKIRSVNGGLVISSANGRIKSVAETTGEPSYYVLGIEGDNQFVTDDLVRCQVFTSGQAKYYWVAVASVTDDSILILKSEFADGVAPAPGDDLIQMGNQTNKARQGFLYLTASEDGKPRFSVMDGVDSTSTVGKSKVILGCLDGMTDTDFPADFQPSGWGLYAMNVFLKGVFLLRNGKSVESEIESAKNDAQTAKDKADAITRLFQEFTVAGGLFESKITEVKEYAKEKAEAAKGEAINDASGKYNTKSEITSLISQTKKDISLSVTEKISNVQVGGRNYYRKDTAMNSQGTAAIINKADSINGFMLTGAQDVNNSIVRMLNVITSNGYWTISFDVAGTQNASVGFIMDVCDRNQKEFRTTSDNQYTHFEYTVLVDNYTPAVHHFIDFEHIYWAYFNFRNFKVEKGNKATDWTPAPEDVQTQITANAAAIEVNRQGISLKASQEQVNGLNTRLATAEASITPDAIRLTVQSQTIEYANLAAKLAGAKMLYRDPTFKEGFNGIGVYNNSSNGTVVINRMGVQADNPTDSGYQLVITSNGYSMQPGRGGFYFGNPVHIYGEYICKFIAWIPVGSNVCFASNSMGDGGYQKWLTPTAGQGKWAEYVSYVRGGTANTSTTNFYYLDGGAETLSWWLCYATVFECSSAEDTPTRSELKAGINITSGALNIFGQAISLAGAVTFTSLDGDSQSRIISAQNTANTANSAAGAAQSAANEAWSKAENLKNSLGGLAYDNAVTLAKLDSTIIEGGFIKTNLINARSIVTGELIAEQIAATNITTGRLTVTDGAMVAGLRVFGNSLSNEGHDNNAYIVLRNNPSGTFVGIGANILPAMSYPNRATGKFVCSGNYSGMSNTALILEAFGSAGNNIALDMKGKVKTDGSTGQSTQFEIDAIWNSGYWRKANMTFTNGILTGFWFTS